MLTQMEALKKLNISNNLSLSQESVHEIAASLKQMPSLLEIDMSKLRCNSVEFFRELADLLMQNKRLKSISLQRTGMTDALAGYLAEPLVRA